MRTRNIIDIFFIGRTGRPADSNAHRHPANQLNITPILHVTHWERNVYSVVGVLLAVLAAVSCAKDEDTVTLHALMADMPGGGQKVYIDSLRYACWENDDLVAINGTSCTVAVTDGSNREATMQVRYSESGYTGAYPADYVKTCTGGNVVLTMPSTQTVVMENGHQQIVAPMVGYTANDKPSAEEPLRFHNVAGVLKINVKNSLSQGLNIYALEIESSNAYIAGTGTVDGVDTPTPSLTISSDKTKKVMLMCNDTTLAQGNTADFYLVVAPFADPTKFTVHVLATGADNLKYTFHRESKSGITIARNQIGSISVDVDSTYTHTRDEGNYFWGQGTEKCPFRITCYEDLNTLRNLVNHSGTVTPDDEKYNRNTVYYRQTADIDIPTGINPSNPVTSNNWGTSTYPVIGNNTSSSHFFQANYDGQFHTISGLNNNKQATGTPLTPLGLFGYVGQGCIKNLNVTGDFTTNQTISVGGLVGEVHLDEEISNCTNYINITLAKPTDAAALGNYGYGGICGIAKGGNATINYCSNHGTIKNSDDCYCKEMLMGGILGKNEKTNTYISYCKNYGEITNKSLTHSSTAYGSMGGICGATIIDISILHCQNYGDISTNYNGSSALLIGGILGGLIASRDNTVINLKFNRNKGNISCSTSTYISAGGCVGSLLGTYKYSGFWPSTSGSSKNHTCTFDIVNDTNDGNITSAGGISYYCGTGGVVGYMSGNNSSMATISTSINQSNSITSTKPHVGGIIGYSEVPTTASGLINNGSVTGAYSTSGIIGTQTKSATLERCINNAAITATGSVASGVSGIIGTATGAIIISKCLNTNTITSSDPNINICTGGLIGYMGEGVSITMTDCGNTGNLVVQKGASVAGLVGRCYKSSTSSITNSYSKGNISMSSNPSLCGGISTLSNCKNSITIANCYFSGEISGSPDRVSDILSGYSNTDIGTATNCYSLHPYSTGNFNTNANYTIIDEEGNTDNNGISLIKALNDNRGSNDEWVGGAFPHLNWEPNDH